MSGVVLPVEQPAPLAGVAVLLADEPAVRSASGGQGEAVAVGDAARPLFLAALARATARRPIVVAVPTATEAERIAHDLRQLLGAGAVEQFPAWETLPFERVSPGLETMGRRMRVLWRLRNLAASDAGVRASGQPLVVVAPIRALVQRLGPHVADVEPVTVSPGGRLDRDEFVARLVEIGYRREYQVEARGEVAVRGSIVDVYPVTADHPVRIDLWGDEVDRLTEFSIADQRSTVETAAVTIFPAREILPTADVRARAAALIDEQPWGAAQWERIEQGQTFDGMESWLPWLAPDERLLPDLLGPAALVVLLEPRRLRDRAQDLLDEEAALADALAVTWDAPGGRAGDVAGGRAGDVAGGRAGDVAGGRAGDVAGDSDGGLPRLSLPFDRLLAQTRAGVVPVLTAPESPATPHLAAGAFDPVVGDSAALAKRLAGLRAEGYRVLLAAEGRGSADRLAQVLADEGVVVDIVGAIPERSPLLDTPGARIVVAPLDRGAVVPGARLALVAEADLTGRRRVHRTPRGAKRATDYYEGLSAGDYVVHRQHGIGRFVGMVSRTMFDLERDYLLVEFRGDEKVYVPTDQIDIVRKYTGGDTPKLSKMGGSDWQKTKARVRDAVRDVAGELVVLYRRRLATPGHQFGPDTPWQHEIEDAFPFEETPDQLRAIEETKADMERPVPMDRLVCGDVGYGKTEVAIRATFKAVQDGMQAAVLVPTTLLASQHGQTFRERFANYPVRVEVLSRFLSTKEQNVVLRGLGEGTVDVVIGTHRLLSEDVKFKNLGLLIVDEEQRFGVMHKERIKQVRAGIDALALTATPIPRTLELSLTGIRDLSLVNTPPEDRQPILTYVGPYEHRAVAESIRRELLREGQVLYVHNRVQDIEHVAHDVRELVPEARVDIAHGQMDENRLERVVTSFWEHEFDVLVCTTIVESGLDMPTVNTLVVDRADLLGLAQLYQLRGRVGRRGQRAYAYLLHPPDRALSEEAYERLKTIGEYTDLGSGFKIAMRDLEIRGAGNLLGAEQSGQIAAVGFDLYMEMVTEAVGELTGEVATTPADVSIDLPVDAHLPRDYIARDDVRLEAYRHLAAVTTDHDVDEVAGEWADRYGPPPAPAAALLDVARLRVACLERDIREVSLQRGRARFTGLELRKSQEVRLKQLAPGATVVDGVVTVPFKGAGASASIAEALRLVLTQIAPVDRAPVASPSA